MEYKVTIGIPVYNAEKYIRYAIESVLVQTFKDIELLICDDCGTDASINIVKEYQQNHPRGKDIHVVNHTRNMGIGESRNLIIEKAQGAFLYFMDADDSIEPNTIELLYNNVQHYNAEIVYGSYERIEDFEGRLKIMPCRFASMQFVKENEFALWAYEKYGNLPAMTWNFLIDINIFRKNNIKYQPINYWEDFTMTMDLPIYITRAVLLPDITYHYHCRYDSASNFQKRSHISKEEIKKTIDAITRVKNNSIRYINKPFSNKRLLKVMKTCYFIVDTILSRKSIIHPSFSDKELHEIMHYPLSLRESLKMHNLRFGNIIFYFGGIMPPCVSISFIRVMRFIKTKF